MNALQMYIGGRWVASVSGATYQARSPATGEAIATLPEGTREDAQRAIAAADEGKARLARMSVWDRARGNAMVWVPAPTTSVVAVKLMGCLEEAEVPAGAINLVTGPGPVVGDEIVAQAGTDAVAFAGSSATGEHIARRAAGKPLLLELGGNGPTLILDDADLVLASGAEAFGAFL